MLLAMFFFFGYFSFDVLIKYVLNKKKNVPKIRVHVIGRQFTVVSKIP